MAFTVPVAQARPAFEASVTAFVDAIGSLPEWELFAGSRCHGWSRLDVATHVIAGWQEMLGGFVSVVDDAPTVDAASYWTAFAGQSEGEDRVEVLAAQRRRAAAYGRPAAMVEQLRDVSDAVLRAARTMRDQPCRWQGHVFAPGDFLAVWAVEDVIHHLDLGVEVPPPADGLALSRATVEALVAGPVPTTWVDRTDEQTVLIGAGRLAVPADAAGSGLPVLG